MCACTRWSAAILSEPALVASAPRLAELHVHVTYRSESWRAELAQLCPGLKTTW